MNEELKRIFQDGIKVGEIVVPVAHIRYYGDESQFVTWQITDDSPELSANDEQLYGVCSVDVDVYSNGSYLETMKVVKNLMKKYGWLWIRDSSEMFEEDTKLYHRTMSFEKEEYIWQE